MSRTDDWLARLGVGSGPSPDPLQAGLCAERCGRPARTDGSRGPSSDICRRCYERIYKAAHRPITQDVAVKAMDRIEYEKWSLENGN